MSVCVSGSQCVGVGVSVRVCRVVYVSVSFVSVCMSALVSVRGCVYVSGVGLNSCICMSDLVNVRSLKDESAFVSMWGVSGCVSVCICM